MEEKEQLLRSNFREEELQENFRSAPVIVNTNNELFPCMNRILMEGAETVGLGALKALFDNEGQRPRDNEEEGWVHFEILPDQKEPEKEEEGDRTVERCAELLKGPLKDVPSSEIAILTRKNAEGARIAAALMEEGFDVLSSESLHLDQSEAVNFLVELFRVIEDPLNEIAKLEAVRYLLEHQGRSEELHRWTAPHWSTNEKGKNGKINLQGAWDAMGVEFDLARARNAPLYRTAEDAIRAFKLDEPASPYIQFFLDHLFRFTERYGDELRAFLEDWDGMANKPSIKVPNELDAVRVMTIHSSKGLEFPYVIIPGPERYISYSKDRIWVDPNGYINELPAAMVSMNKHLKACPEPYATEEARERYRSRLDALNLLYVAMTRAEKGLFVLIQEPPHSSSPSDLLDKTLLTALNECYGEIPEEGLSFGSLPEAVPERKGTAGVPIEKVPHEAWDERIEIRPKAPKGADLEEPEAEKKTGEAVHEAISRIEDPTELPRALDELRAEGFLDQGERTELQDKLGTLIEQEGVAPFFQRREDQKLIREQDILTPEGGFIRPDRVLIEGDRAQVLEIKTGSRNRDHHQQLARYRAALEEMGYRAEGYLLYTEEGSLVPLEEE
jgi:ATP-dependent exoDNAse (exonuclease V) beta subunit